MKNFHAVVTVLAVTLYAITFLGCNEKHRKSPPPSNSAPIGTTIQTQAEELGPFVEGRIIEHHYKSHPEWDFTLRTTEPLVNRGRWINTPKGVPVWVPFWVENAGLLNTVLLEVDQTAPEPGPGISSSTIWPDPTLPVRVVICSPGSFCYDLDGVRDGTNLARGLCSYKSWYNPDTQQYEDVLFVSWRVSQFEAGKYLPALNHEISHQITRDPLFNHNNPTGEAIGEVLGNTVACWSNP